MKSHLARKIVTVEQLKDLARGYHLDGARLIHCHGCFDVVHPGHVRYLQSAGSHGDVLIVSLTGDDAIEKSDGTRPYIPQEYRAENLAALEFVDHVVVADGPTAEPVIEAMRPHLYIKGQEYEHSCDPRFLAERRLVERCGGRVMFSSGDVVFSSTTILDGMSNHPDWYGRGSGDEQATSQLSAVGGNEDVNIETHRLVCRQAGGSIR